ncbi:hypothetical protein AB4084_00405, partial [Lysobacter sp. 2RAB21]
MAAQFEEMVVATDAVQAAREARRLAGTRAGRVGYQGGSQGGWVAPLAARIEPVDFVIVSFGLAVSPREEDREAIAADLARAGFGSAQTAKALEVADATAAIVESDFREGFERLDEVKRKYAGQPWFSAIRGNYSGFMLSASAQDLRTQAPALVAGIEVRYDPMPVLNNLAVPQLWLLGGQDRDAPPGETVRRVIDLSAGYDLSKTGQYVVAFNAPLQHASTSDRVMLQQSNGLPMSVQSAPLSLWVDGLDQLGGAKVSAAAKPVGTKAVVNGVNYVGCTTPRTSSAGQAVVQARAYAENAKGYLNNGTVGPRYTTWFGAYTSSRYSTARSHFASIDSAIDQSGGQIT